MNLTAWKRWSDSMVSHYIRRDNIQVSARRRHLLRALSFQSWHKTLTDNFGNFEAMFTDGTIVWIKLADDRVEIVELANIHIPKEHKQRATAKFKPKKPKKPTKTQLKVLEFFKSLGIDP